jgi:outer membrane immunogenic protein
MQKLNRAMAAGVASSIVMLALPATSASAADMPVKAPRPAPVAAAVYSWTGFYIGGHVGYGWGEFDTTAVTATGSFPAGFQFATREPNGILAGGQIGFNYQTGNVVLGVEAQGSWADMNDSVRTNSPVNTNYNIARAEVDWIVTVAGRLGIAVNNWLLYGKGGWAWAKTQAHAETFNAAGTLLSITTNSGTRDGWMAGVGGEYGFAGNWSVKIEYNYIDLGKDRVASTNTTVPGGVVTTLLRDSDAQIHLIKGGINFRWGGAAPVVARY